jgi:uncharacterized protein (DUF1800 family)
MLRSVPLPWRAALAACAIGIIPATTAQQPAREQTADQQVRHVLNRLAFGPRPGDYERVRSMGVDAWIEQQLHPEQLTDAPATQFIAQLGSYTASASELLAEYPRPAQIQQQLANARTQADSAALRGQAQEGRRVIAEVQAARVGRAVVGEKQLEEVMVDFWLNHFSVFSGKGAQMRYYLPSYERETIRPRVFGKFRDLLGAVAKSPAMLIYLDNAQSQADSTHATAASAPRPLAGRGRLIGRGQQPPPPPGRSRGLNENYARELLELHTLGVDGGYTQKDVIEVARAFTGWTIVPPQLNDAAMQMDALGGGAGRGRGGRAGAVGGARAGLNGRGRNAAAMGAVIDGQFMFRPQVHDADRKTVLGVTLGAGRGIEDGEQVLDIVAHHPSTARFIATKLARRFVSDSPSAALIDRAAGVFRATDGDLREVVRTIVTSPEFFSASAYRSKVKSPFELVVSTLRAVGAAADPTPRSAQLVATLGQPIFGRQTPDGWPETGAQWINTGSILARINFGTAVAAGRVPGSSVNSWPLPIGLRRDPREKQVDAVVAAFLGGEVSPETRAVLIAGNNPLSSQAPPDSTMMMIGGGRALPALEGLPQIVGLALGSPEFQRR